MVNDQRNEGRFRKGLLPKENLSKPIDPNSLKPQTDRRTADCLQVFSDCLCLVPAPMPSILPTSWELVSTVLSHPREKQADII